MNANQNLIIDLYQRLLLNFGPQGWWPGDTQEEIILGAILTQAVSWSNVEKAINNLKNHSLLNFAALAQAEDEQILPLIKPALYHRQKLRKIRAFLKFLQQEYAGSLEQMWTEDLAILRTKLLNVWGIGPETADSILLYAGEKAIFVVDAYTKRIFSRLGMVNEEISYHDLQYFLEQNTEKDVAIYNEFHALLVALGASCCRKNRPLCPSCPLSGSCKYFRGRQEIDNRR